MMVLNKRDAKSNKLVGRWQLNEGKGKVALDSSPKDNTGVFGGDLSWTNECSQKLVKTPVKKPNQSPKGCKISTGAMVYHYPLTSCTMEIKTTKFNVNTLKNFGKLKGLMRKKSPRGYC
jgi:hypothetical protein